MSDSNNGGIARPPATAVAVVYVACLLQGLTLVSFPALSSVLHDQYGFTDADYGAIFLPEMVFAVTGAIIGGVLARRLGLKRLLALSLIINGVSQALLAAIAVVPGDAQFPAVLAGAGALGLAFGLTGAPINSYPGRLFPRHVHSAVVAAHMLIGVGLAVGPLLTGLLVTAGVWTLYPVLLVIGSAVLAVLTLMAPMPPGDATTQPHAATAERPLAAPMFWTFIAIGVLYAFTEAAFANWVVLYLAEYKGLAEPIAASALSTFWAAIVAGRLVASAVVVRVRSVFVWIVLPVFMIAALALLPYAVTPTAGIIVFAFAGFACSAFFPLTIALAAHRFPGHVAWVSSMLIAALMVGVGIGSFLIGSLRDLVSFETIFQWSMVCPLALLFLALPVLRWEKVAHHGTTAANFTVMPGHEKGALADTGAPRSSNSRRA